MCFRFFPIEAPKRQPSSGSDGPLTCAKCRVHVRRARLRHPGPAPDLVDQLREHSELMPYVQTVASSILITMDRGRCRLCGGEDTRLSFGETSRWGGRSWLGDRGVELRNPTRRRPHGSDRDTGKSQAPRLLNLTHSGGPASWRLLRSPSGNVSGGGRFATAVSSGGSRERSCRHCK